MLKAGNQPDCIVGDSGYDLVLAFARWTNACCLPKPGPNAANLTVQSIHIGTGVIFHPRNSCTGCAPSRSIVSQIIVCMPFAQSLTSSAASLDSHVILELITAVRSSDLGAKEEELSRVSARQEEAYG